MDIQLMSVEHKYPRMDISLQLSMLLLISIWLSIDFYGYPCMDLLGILDPGVVSSGTCYVRTTQREGPSI